MESYDLTCLRVKYSKAPYNMSQQDISQLFEGCHSASELKNLKKIVDKCVDLVTECYNSESTKDAKILVHNLLAVLVENENAGRTSYSVKAEKINGKWSFKIGY